MACNKLVIWQFILMETPMNDDSDDGSGGGDGGNIVLNIMTIHIE